MQAKENWGETCLMQRVSRNHKEMCKGRSRWMSARELEQRYGDPQLVAELIGRKAWKHALLMCVCVCVCHMSGVGQGIG